MLYAFLCLSVLPVAIAASHAAPTSRPAPAVAVVVCGDEQRQVNLKLPDGGLRPVAGVHNIQVFRASRGRPADGDGWTYAHHQDLACWKGRLYAAWAMTPVDEDVPPYKVVYATSADGLQWSAPADLFPRQHAWACRFYFYRAGNGRMLAFCAGKSSDGTVTEATKKVLLVREITTDHRLGEVFTLVGPLAGQPPSYDTAKDSGFVVACREAAGNNLLLEQQDYGVFLGDRRMKWHKDAPKLDGWAFGKALCFYHRADGAVVGLSKMGFAVLSRDEGKTWSKPALPPTLIAGGAKVWGQRTADGRYALAYNPDRAKRYPLVLVHGDDGVTYGDMRVIHGEFPRRRYAGSHKDVGAQYVRGLAEWANDGTLADKKALWLIYSVHKEDIWVARIPLPIQPDATVWPADDSWNIYSPRWAPISVVEEDGRRCLEMRDADPFDYARAVRLFPPAARVRVELRIRPAQTGAPLEIDLCDATGRRPVRVMLGEKVQACDGAATVDLGAYTADAWLSLALTTDLAAGRYTAQLNGGDPKVLATAEKNIASVERLSLRTGPWRGCGDGPEVDPKADVPLPKPAVFRIRDVSMREARAAVGEGVPVASTRGTPGS